MDKLYWIGISDRSALEITMEIKGGGMVLESLRAIVWRADPPTKPGWYWAMPIIDMGYEVRPMLVRIDMWQSEDEIENELHVETAGSDEGSWIVAFSHWLGPIPEPQAPDAS